MSRSRSLLSQVLAINALLVAMAVLVATVSARLDLQVLPDQRSFLVFVLAILVTLLANAFLLRRRFAPLEELLETMERIDLAEPGLRAPDASRGTEEVERLQGAFNRMLDRVEEERRSAGRAVLRAQESERRRVAQDLHDEVNQSLTAILLRLEAATHDAPPELQRELRETKRLAGQAMEELLRLARELRPTALDDHGLLAALRTQVADFGERTGIDARFVRSGEAKLLSPEQQLVIYRVTQESLSNVAQHAAARRVDVELSFVGRTHLSVADDGRGFSGQGRDGGLGLSGMRERALLVGGSLQVRTQPGRGTRVELTIR